MHFLFWTNTYMKSIAIFFYSTYYDLFYTMVPYVSRYQYQNLIVTKNIFLLIKPTIILSLSDWWLN